jgi:hypothetical protein
MEWEPINQSFVNKELDFNFEETRASPRFGMAASNEPPRTISPHHQDLSLEGSGLHDADVLLGGAECRLLANFVKGTSFYREQLRQCRPWFIQTTGAVERRELIVHSIMMEVWAKDGRFLAFDNKIGNISILPNAKALKVIQSDLRRAPRQNRVKQSISSSRANNNNKKIAPATKANQNQNSKGKAKNTKKKTTKNFNTKKCKPATGSN